MFVGTMGLCDPHFMSTNGFCPYSIIDGKRYYCTNNEFISLTECKYKCTDGFIKSVKLYQNISLTCSNNSSNFQICIAEFTFIIESLFYSTA